jgi:hypothetical protein
MGAAPSGAAAKPAQGEAPTDEQATSNRNGVGDIGAKQISTEPSSSIAAGNDGSIASSISKSKSAQLMDVIKEGLITYLPVALVPIIHSFCYNPRIILCMI